MQELEYLNCTASVQNRVPVTVSCRIRKLTRKHACASEAKSDFVRGVCLNLNFKLTSYK